MNEQLNSFIEINGTFKDTCNVFQIISTSFNVKIREDA